MIENAENEREKMFSDARKKVTTIRGSMKRECENVSNYMASLMESVEGVVKACNETKTITDKAFGAIEPPKDKQENIEEKTDRRLRMRIWRRFHR